MYNKALNCRFKHAGRQGRSKHKLRFPRHIINRYEGTHLSMRPKETWPEYRCPWPNMKHVKGLINKFVGKPYNKFLKVWHAKLEHVDARIKDSFSLKRVIDPEPIQHRFYSVRYYIDENGLIQKYKVEPRHKYRYKLTKQQRRYNDSVKIPNLGVCKYDVSPYNLYKHGKTNPILLGDFYVALEGNVVKVPVYTCCSQLMIDYHHADNLSKFIEDNDLKLEEKKRQITETWIRIVNHSYFGNSITNNLDHQYIFKEIPNPSRANLIKQLHIAISVGDTEEVDKLRDVITNTPKTKTIDVGYGKFYLFVKRKDIEKAKDI